MSHQRPSAGLRARALGVLLCLLVLPAIIASHASAAAPEQRQLYRSALAALNDGHIAAFHSTTARLTDYPLYPYLDYADHARRLPELSESEVADFRARWSDTPLADRLYGTWLDNLASRGAWDVYLRNYSSNTAPTADVARQCTYLRALDRSGEHTAAMAGVGVLWRVGTSQPKACDALFALWITRGHVTNGIVWDRLTLALQARSWELARYLAALLSPELKRQGDLFYRVARDPALVRDTARFATNDEATRAIVVFGVRRLAQVDPDAAAGAWSTYRDRLTFDASQSRTIRQDITIGFARHGILDGAADLTPSPDGRHLLVYEALILAAINNQHWPSVVSFIEQLDESERAKQRWQYWLGRAQRALNGATTDAPGSQVPQSWQTLAADRQYYGFLAAEALGKTLALNDQSARPDAAALHLMQERAAMQRMTELYAVADRTNARREWALLSSKLDPSQRATAAYMIADMGWLDLSIIAANAADLHDDLALRFPAPFSALFAKESRANRVPISYLYGIARQESAFGANARSSAGARGLMQLMPATAAGTARNMGESAPPTDALFDPQTNVRIASRHVAELLARYAGNRVLVAAAYNAGPHRVDRWLSQRPARPADIWIEMIPFPETRDYVKNVIAFSYIYGQRLGKPTQFLEADER